MNELEKQRLKVKRAKKMYPPGTRIELLVMGNDPHPVQSGTRGTVRQVDDLGILHCDFDDGRHLGIIPGEDAFRPLMQSEIEAEQREKEEYANENKTDIAKAREAIRKSKESGYGISAPIKTEKGTIVIDRGETSTSLYIKEIAEKLEGRPVKSSIFEFEKTEDAEKAAVVYLAENRYPDKGECRVIRANEDRRPENRLKLTEKETEEQLKRNEREYKNSVHNDVTGEDAGYEIFGNQIMMYIDDNAYDNDGAKMFYRYESKTVEEAKQAVKEYMVKGKLPEMAIWNDREIDCGSHLVSIPGEDSFRPTMQTEIESDQGIKDEYVDFGDGCQIRLPEKPINCSRLGYFDELEEDCWQLVKQYCATFGIELLPQEDGEAPISFDIAKGIQDYILEQLQEAGVRFNFEAQETDDAEEPAQSM